MDVFDSSSIESVIAALEEYRRYIPDMLMRYVRELADAGYKVAIQAVKDGQGDSTEYNLYIEEPKMVGNAAIIEIKFDGKDCLFIEFGAGIYYNNGNAHPKAGEFGMGVGTYPNQKYAINPGYWYWYEGEGDAKVAHFSRGTEAAMPMYKASLEVIREAERIAKRTFW